MGVNTRTRHINAHTYTGNLYYRRTVRVLLVSNGFRNTLVLLASLFLFPFPSVPPHPYSHPFSLSPSLTLSLSFSLFLSLPSSFLFSFLLSFSPSSFFRYYLERIYGPPKDLSKIVLLTWASLFKVPAIKEYITFQRYSFLFFHLLFVNLSCGRTKRKCIHRRNCNLLMVFNRL